MAERLMIDDAVAAALGKTKEQLSRMTLSKFAELVFDKGYAIDVTGWSEAAGEGKLRVTMESRSDRIARGGSLCG